MFAFPTQAARLCVVLLCLGLAHTPKPAHATIDAGTNLHILRVSPQGRLLVGRGHIAEDWHELLITTPNGGILEQLKVDYSQLDATRGCIKTGKACDPKLIARLAHHGLDKAWKGVPNGFASAWTPGKTRGAILGMRPDGVDIWILEGDWIIQRIRWRFDASTQTHSLPNMAWSEDGRVLTVVGELLEGISEGAHHWRGFARAIVVDRPLPTHPLTPKTIASHWRAWSDAAYKRCRWDARHCHMAETAHWQAHELDPEAHPTPDKRR